MSTMRIKKKEGGGGKMHSAAKDKENKVGEQRVKYVSEQTFLFGKGKIQIEYSVAFGVSEKLLTIQYQLNLHSFWVDFNAWMSAHMHSTKMLKTLQSSANAKDFVDGEWRRTMHHIKHVRYVRGTWYRYSWLWRRGTATEARLTKK